MKKRMDFKKIFIRAILFLVLIVICTISVLGIMQRTGIEFTQLASSTSSQSMGYVIKTKNGKVIVIDGGVEEDSDNLLRYINEYGGKVDAWYITHPHVNNMGAFCNIISKNIDFPVKNIYVSLNDKEWYEKYTDDNTINEVRKFFDVIENDKIKNKINYVFAGQIMEYDNLSIEVLGEKNEDITSNSVNNSSMVLKLQVNDKSILILGDAGAEAGIKLLKNVQYEKIKSDYVQVAHYGHNGVELQFYDIVNPRYCLWSMSIDLSNNDSSNDKKSENLNIKETYEYICNLGVQKHYFAKNGNKTLKIW